MSKTIKSTRCYCSQRKRRDMRPWFGNSSSKLTSTAKSRWVVSFYTALSNSHQTRTNCSCSKLPNGASVFSVWQSGSGSFRVKFFFRPKHPYIRCAQWSSNHTPILPIWSISSGSRLQNEKRITKLSSLFHHSICHQVNHSLKKRENSITYGDKAFHLLKPLYQTKVRIIQVTFNS